MKYKTASFTDAGPRQVNEDSVGIWNLDNGGLAVAIADGLGGMGGGDVASRTAVAMFGEAATTCTPGNLNLSAVVESIHAHIRSLQQQDSKESAMATTLTAAVFFGSQVHGVHCGDSRASVARSDGIIRLTKDHTEAQILFDRGRINKEELANYPRKHILHSAIGAIKVPKIDQFHFKLIPGDKLFFTTDGFHGKIFLREMRAIAAKYEEPSEFSEVMRTLVKERIPDDNFSLVTVFLHDR